MDHKTLDKIVNERERENDRDHQSEREEIRIVYTPANLVRVGQQIMRDRKKMQDATPVPG